MERIFLYRALLTIIFALIPTLATASAFNGFYTGLSVGGALRIGKGKTETRARIALPAPGPSAALNPVSLSFDVNRSSLFGDFSAGYGYSFCDYYLGLEASVSLSTYSVSTPVESIAAIVIGGGAVSASNLVNSIKTKLNPFEFGIDLRPGYLLFWDTMLYGRVGVAFNRLSIANSSTMNFTAVGVSGAQTVFFQRRVSRAALRLGLGLERYLYDDFALRVDYIFTYYGGVSVSNNTPANVGGAITFIANDTTLNRLYGNVLKVGLFYYW